jgi:rhodanese-related sulfurtransferase
MEWRNQDKRAWHCREIEGKNIYSEIQNAEMADIDIELLDICGSHVQMGRSVEGELYRKEKDSWEKFPFNEQYKGYYDSCSFTALAYSGGQFYAAGLDDKWRPHLFVSVLGTVWGEQSLQEVRPNRESKWLKGRIIKILFSDKPFQVLLLTDQKELAAIPDCPMCMVIRELPETPIDAVVKPPWIEIKWKSGKTEKVSIHSVAQYRISWTYGAKLVHDHKASIIYITGPYPDRFVDYPIDKRLSSLEVERWLEDQNEDDWLLFLCETGTRSDRSAELAQQLGFSHAYSLGGTEPYCHII